MVAARSNPTSPVAKARGFRGVTSPNDSDMIVTTVNLSAGFVEFDRDEEPGLVEAELPTEYAVDWSNVITVNDGAQRAPIVARWTVVASGLCASTCVDTEGAMDATIEITDRRTGESYEGEVTLVPQPGRSSVARQHPLGTWGSRDNWASEDILRALRDDEAADVLTSRIVELVNFAARG